MNARRRCSQTRLKSLGQEEWADVTFVPGATRRGHLHPLTLILREVKAIFSRLGYEVAVGPQVEDEFHNFEALNIPSEHPARETMDSFYLEENRLLLRTHTSPVQIRFMEGHRPPIRIIAPGTVYRRDATDPAHGSQFNQFEALCVDRDIRLSDLKGTIEYFARSLFGPRAADPHRRVTTFPSPSRASGPPFPAASAVAVVAGAARTAGSRSWVPAWFIPRCCATGVLTPGSTAASPSVRGWTG